jgi:hypothetical protein
MKLPHWLVVLAACAVAAVPVLVSDLPAKWAALAPALVALAGVIKAALPKDPPITGTGAS